MTLLDSLKSRLGRIAPTIFSSFMLTWKQKEAKGAGAEAGAGEGEGEGKMCWLFFSRKNGKKLTHTLEEDHSTNEWINFNGVCRAAPDFTLVCLSLVINNKSPITSKPCLGDYQNCWRLWNDYSIQGAVHRGMIWLYRKQSMILNPCLTNSYTNQQTTHQVELKSSVDYTVSSWYYYVHVEKKG